jgi:hypothetical protein
VLEIRIRCVLFLRPLGKSGPLWRPWAVLGGEREARGPRVYANKQGVRRPGQLLRGPAAAARGRGATAWPWRPSPRGRSPSPGGQSGAVSDAIAVGPAGGGRVPLCCDSLFARGCVPRPAALGWVGGVRTVSSGG